jgi:hypothetical protein
VTLREQHSARVQRAVLAKMARAKRTFAERYGRLDSQTQTDVVGVILSKHVLPFFDEEKLIDCPACEWAAILFGVREFRGWHVQEEEEGIYSRVPVVVFVPDHLRCEVCGLHLRDTDELEAAGVALAPIPVEGALEEDFVDLGDLGDDDGAE